MTPTAASSWNDRIFGSIPLPPMLIAAGLALTILSLFIATTFAAGDLSRFMEQDTRWWQDRDVRLAVLLALMAAYLPAARRSEELGARRNLEELRASSRWAPGQFEAASENFLSVEPRARRVPGALALLVIPVTALLVDRDPSLYFQSYYWDVAHFWTYGLAGMVCWNLGVLVHAVSMHRRVFSRMARILPGVDLLNLGVFKPFTRQALLSALPGVVILSLFSLNLADRGFLWAIGILGSVAFFWTTVSLYLLMRGVRDRIREEKRLEFARVNSAIRGDLTALRDSPIGTRAGELTLGDMLAYRAFVESVPEWPFDAPMRVRFLLYLVIPLGSWLGGALVERLLDGLLA